MKTIIMVLAILFATTTTFAQSSKSSTHKRHHQHGMKAKYTCTMHPEVMKKRPGKCPECGMKLVKAKKSMAQMAYQCPMKCEGEKTYAKAGKCPKCEMDMVKMKKTRIKAEKLAEPMKM